MEESLSKQVQKREHSDTKQCTDDTPSKRIHSKNTDSEGNKDFTQWWMRIFVIVQIMNHLIRRTGMINLIKICSAAEGMCIVILILLIKKFRILVIIDRNHLISVRVFKYHFF